MNREREVRSTVYTRHCCSKRLDETVRLICVEAATHQDVVDVGGETACQLGHHNRLAENKSAVTSREELDGVETDQTEARSDGHLAALREEHQHSDVHWK